MTDLSGIDSNKVFRNALPPSAPYYYIRASLDLAGLVLDEPNEDIEVPHITLYFNRDNNYDYLDPKNDYHGFHVIESNGVIGDVVVYSNSDLVSNKVLEFEVGGAVDVESPVSVVWGGQTGFVSGGLNVNDINNGQVCYYGHEGGHRLSADNPDSNLRRYLAVTIYDNSQVNAPNEPEVESVRSLYKSRRQRLLRQLEDYAVDSGALHVIVKVYPKSA
jgi:hypothetical protein